MTTPDKNLKSVPLPSLVQISVEELHELRHDSALLAALKQLNVEQWSGYKAALWLLEHDPNIRDIKLGWAADKKNKERRKQKCDRGENQAQKPE